MATQKEQWMQELTQARQRVVELERDNQRLKARLAQADQNAAKRDAPPLYERYQALFDHMPLPLVIFREDGLIAGMNHRSEELLNMSRERVVGIVNPFVDDPEVKDKGYIECLHQALRGRIVTMAPTPYVKTWDNADGEPQQEVLWMETIYYPLYTPGEAFHYVVSIKIDVTEHMQAQEALSQSEIALEQHVQILRESQDLLEGILESSPVVVSIRDPQGRLLISPQPPLESRMH